MKKSTQATCCIMIAAFILAVVTVMLAFCGMLPCLMFAVRAGLVFVGIALFEILLLAAISACRCTRKLAVALCRYGTCLVIMLTIALLAGLVFVAIPMLEECLVLFLIVLFIDVFAFTAAVMLFAAMASTMAHLGCPRCKTTIQHECEGDADLDDFNF